MRMLLVTSRFPLPAWRGNQVRTMEWLRAVGSDPVTLVCPEPTPGTETGGSLPSGVQLLSYRAGVLDRAGSIGGALARGWPAQEGLYATRGGRRSLAAAIGERTPDIAVVQMIRCGWALDQIRRDAPATTVIFDAIDAMGLHFDRAAQFAGPLLRPMLHAEAGRCRRRERDLVRRADLVVAVAQRDLEALGAGDRGRVVPVSGRRPAIERRESPSPIVLLSGNLGYRPTVQGARWFAGEVWPAVVARLPQARWVLAGARPAAAIRRLASLPGVEVHADVASLDPFLASATVAIAPMASGSGVPMKVLEAWAAGVPVVAHPWTADGVDHTLRDALVVAEHAEAWRARLLELLTLPDQALLQGERGREAWRRTYSPDRVVHRLRTVLAEACATSR